MTAKAQPVLGKFSIVEVSPGKFRGYNVLGQPITPVVEGGTEVHRKFVEDMSRQAGLASMAARHRIELAA